MFGQTFVTVAKFQMNKLYDDIDLQIPSWVTVTEIFIRETKSSIKEMIILEVFLVLITLAYKKNPKK